MEKVGAVMVVGAGMIGCFVIKLFVISNSSQVNVSLLFTLKELYAESLPFKIYFTDICYFTTESNGVFHSDPAGPEIVA